MRRYRLASLCLPGIVLLAAPVIPDAHLILRSRVEAFKGSGQWQNVSVEYDLPVSRTALILCDVWDHHWCSTASERVDALARKISTVVDLARAKGILIIHAPSDTLAFYKNHPARLNILRFPQAQPPAPLALSEPPLPIDDSDGGCDNPKNALKPNTRVWTRENAAIHIQNTDLISDNGQEVYNALRARGIRTLLYAGVHANMCVLNRSFAIRQMTRWGMRCILVRDLTDAMYNPAMRPLVSHEKGTAMVVEHIESYWAPTITSAELTGALQGSSRLNRSN